MEGCDTESQGWYRKDTPLRVRFSIEDSSLCLHSLTGDLVARWSLDHLENHSVPVLGRD